METHAAIRILSAAAWVFLLFNSFRLRLFSKYRLVFVFVFYSILLEVSLPWIAAALGAGTPEYTAIYSILASINALLTIAVLLYIYGIFGPFGLAKHWHLAAVPSMLAYLVFSDDRDAVLPMRVINAASLMITYIGVATIVRSRRCKGMRIGWNLKMVLLAITVPFVFQSIVFSVYTLGLPLSYAALGIWQNATSLAAWIILAVGMIEYSPPTLVVAENSESAKTNGDPGREGTVGNLSETRDQLC